MFGTVGYVAMLFVWLLVLDLIVILASLGGVVDDISTSIGTTTNSMYLITPTTVQADPASSHAPLKFLLTVVLIVLVWIFSYFVAKAASKTLRHMLVLFGRKLTIASLTMAKYLVMSMGLIGLIVLLQFVEPTFVELKLPIAFMGLAAGVLGVGAVWAQRVLVARHHVSIDRVL